MGDKLEDILRKFMYACVQAGSCAVRLEEVDSSFDLPEVLEAIQELLKQEYQRGYEQGRKDGKDDMFRGIIGAFWGEDLLAYFDLVVSKRDEAEAKAIATKNPQVGQNG